VRPASIRPLVKQLFKITNVGISAEFRGVITDWGGVFTTPILTTVRAWIEADEIDWDSYRTVMRRWVAQAYDIAGDTNPIHALERGECATDEFERILAARLFRTDGGTVAAEGLLQRMFAASERVPAMYGAIRAVRGAGLRTGLLSNSWGPGDYPLEDFPGLFDAVVISGEVGMRKPEAGIFLRAADALGLAPAQCVFIDDMEANVAAATDLGMTAVLHTEAAVTVAALEDLLGLPLNGSEKTQQAP
jgi:putative hydrolase of the HAD superfamily